MTDDRQSTGVEHETEEQASGGGAIGTVVGATIGPFGAALGTVVDDTRFALKLSVGGVSAGDTTDPGAGTSGTGIDPDATTVEIADADGPDSGAADQRADPDAVDGDDVDSEAPGTNDED